MNTQRDHNYSDARNAGAFSSPTNMRDGFSRPAAPESPDFRAVRLPGATPAGVSRRASRSRTWNYTANVQCGCVELSSRQARGAVEAETESEARDLARAEIESQYEESGQLTSVFFTRVW